MSGSRGLMLRAILSSPINLLMIAAPVSWAIAAFSAGSPWVFLTAAISLIPLARADRSRHRGARAAVRPGLGRLPQRDVRQRRGADHRGRRAARRARRARQGVDHRQHHRQPAAGARPVVLRRRDRPPHRRSSIAPPPPTPRRCCSSAVVALVMPAVFDLSLYGNLGARPPAIERLSFWSAHRADGRRTAAA